MRPSADWVKQREKLRKGAPQPEFFVWWQDITQRDVTSLRRCVENATREEDVQQFLTKKPFLLLQHLGGWHGRWVIPKKKLGAEYVTDFVIGSKSSPGFRWVAVELESPKARMFTKAGNPSARLTHAIKQIQDWRAWIGLNQNYAARPREEQGLGLEDVDDNVPGLILIGRQSEIDPSTRPYRRRLIHDLGIDIHSYDWLIDAGQGTIDVERFGPKRKKRYK